MSCSSFPGAIDKQSTFCILQAYAGCMIVKLSTHIADLGWNITGVSLCQLKVCRNKCCAVPCGRYVRSIVSRHSTRHGKYTPDIINYWTSFWSPIGSIWEFRTKLDDFSAWICAPRLFYVLKIGKNTLQTNIDWHKHMFFKRHVVFSNKQKEFATSLKRCKWGLGTPTHIKIIVF